MVVFFGGGKTNGFKGLAQRALPIGTTGYLVADVIGQYQDQQCVRGFVKQRDFPLAMEARALLHKYVCV
jgi:hypothetical protein